MTCDMWPYIYIYLMVWTFNGQAIWEVDTVNFWWLLQLTKIKVEFIDLNFNTLGLKDEQLSKSFPHLLQIEVMYITIVYWVFGLWYSKKILYLWYHTTTSFFY